MEKHKFNIFPEMNEDDYYRLKSDIERNGYDNSQPIYIFDGFILDGWNRYKACQELDVTPVIKEFHGNEIAALEFVMRTNKRRNLTSSQWAAIAVEADDIWDVLQEDIERERRKKQAEKIKLTERDNTGKFKPVYDNKLTQTETERTTQRMADMFNTNRTYVSDAKKYRNDNPEIFEEIKRGDKNISEVKREEKKKTKEEENRRIQEDREREMKNYKDEDYRPKIYKGRFQDICKDFDDNSIDHIITDPPYPKEYLPDWGDLSKIANRILKPGGFCICYSGKLHLPDVINLMTEHLSYYWQLILLHTGLPAAVHPVKMNTMYKPILIFYKEPRTPQDKYIIDLIKGTGREKYGHKWQQAEDELKQVLDNFTHEGDLILDPFAGSGTTGSCCMKNKRRSILIDINDV